MTVSLSHEQRSMLDGAAGDGAREAMRLIVTLAEVMGAERLRPIVGAHIDSCLYHGPVTLDYARRLVEGGAQVRVPTTLNVSSLDLLHPDLYRGDPETASEARRLMDAYVALGCRPTWTCAPYQLGDRPGVGDHVAWAESNAIVFANSVLGARTHRYGDFVDIAAAITGVVPDAGLHVEAERRAQVVFDLSTLPPAMRQRSAFYPVLGFLIGKRAGSRLPAIVGIPPDASEDQLKALGAAAASSGSVAMFHAVGRTPEAPTLDAASGGTPIADFVTVTIDDVLDARDRLTTATTATGRLGTVSLGTPHYSLNQLQALVRALAGRRVHPDVSVYVSTGRDVLADAAKARLDDALESSGVRIVTDTCTYITPIIEGVTGVAMTDSGKWAYYAPGNLGLDVAFGTLEDCVESAVAGRIVRDDQAWSR